MTNDKIEQKLKQLGREWSADESFIDDVMARVDCEPQRPSTPKNSGSRIMRFSYLAVGTILACLGLWWLWGPQSTGSVLYAQMKEAISQVQSIHMVGSMQGKDGKLHQVAESWFARGQGFAVISDVHIRIDNGTYFWDHQPGSDTASRTKSMGTDKLLDQALNIREELDDQCERYPSGDRSIDGVEHACYRLTFHGVGKPADPSFLDFDKRRTLIFIDPTKLPARLESQENVDGDWKTMFVRTWEYDVSIDPAVFKPNFGDTVRVIDTDKAFEQLTDVENSVHTEHRDGLIYTIHQAKRFENGGVMIMSSVRGTAETLKTFPLTRRMIQPGLYITDGPATNYNASPQGSGYFRLSLARANHRGIDVEWWMMVPRGSKPNWFEDPEGRVQLKLGITPSGEYGKANHTDERGVTHHIYWDLPLNVPKPERIPSLKEIAGHVHGDVSMLGPAIVKHLHMGVETLGDVPTQKSGSTDDVSPEQFAAATREHLQWWERGDVESQLKSGQTSSGNQIGADMRPAVYVNYLSVVDDTTLSRAAERTDLFLLSARGTSITDAGLASLTGLKKLNRLDIAETSITDEGLQNLEAMKSLREVDVTGTLVTQDGIDKLRKALPEAVIVAGDQDTDRKPTDQPPEISNDPLPLPAEVSGVVVDSDDDPVADAKVTVLVRRFSKENDGESDGPGPWSAVTDEKGRYSISPTGTIRPNIDEIRVKVVADGFADVSGVDYEKGIAKGTLPSVRMLPGRRITGQLVDQGGSPVTKAIVRFQSCTENLVTWDSGPFPVDAGGGFSLSVPVDGMVAAAIYPTGFAPRFVDVASETDQGDVVLQKGILRNGRVVDQNGQGVARTVVGVRNTEDKLLHAYMAVIGIAVRTDEAGNFQLPALQGNYKLSVGKSVADYSKQMMLTGESPPSIEPVTIEFDGSTPDELILLRERKL